MELRLDASVLEAWLRTRSLSSRHVHAIRELTRNWALAAAQDLRERAQGDFSYLATAVANDWEAQMLLVTGGYPVQAMSIFRGAIEKLAFIHTFLADPDEAIREHGRLQDAGAAPQHSKKLIVRAFGEGYYRDVFRLLHQHTHADLTALRWMQLNLDAVEDTSQPQFFVGPSYDAQFSYVLSLVLGAGATLAVDCLLTIDPPEDRRPDLARCVVDVIEALLATGTVFSEGTLTKLDRVRGLVAH